MWLTITCGFYYQSLNINQIIHLLHHLIGLRHQQTAHHDYGKDFAFQPIRPCHRFNIRLF